MIIPSLNSPLEGVKSLKITVKSQDLLVFNGLNSVLSIELISSYYYRKVLQELWGLAETSQNDLGQILLPGNAPSDIEVPQMDFLLASQKRRLGQDDGSLGYGFFIPHLKLGLIMIAKL